MKVFVPTPLRSYTDGAAQVTADGTTVAAVLHDLDRQYPGLRFRVVDEQDRLRQHMRVFVGDELTRDLDHPLAGDETLTLMQALSGGCG